MLNKNGDKTQAQTEAEELPEQTGPEAVIKAEPPAGRSPKKGGKRLQKKQKSENPAKKHRKKKTPLRQRVGFGSRRWHRLGLREILILVLPALAAVIAAVAIFLVHRDVKSYELEGQACQYYAGNIYRLQEGAVLRRTSEEKTLLEAGGSDTELSSLPIYYEDKQVVTLPQSMVCYTPRNGLFGRVDYFTEIHYRKGGSLELVRDGEERPLAPGFLFDGRDLYLFLEPMVVSFNGYQMELAPMSYVEAVHNGYVMVFDHGSGEFLMEAPKGAATATSVGGDYTISLLGDSMTDYKGDRTLLFGRPELLEPME